MTFFKNFSLRSTLKLSFIYATAMLSIKLYKCLSLYLQNTSYLSDTITDIAGLSHRKQFFIKYVTSESGSLRKPGR